MKGVKVEGPPTWLREEVATGGWLGNTETLGERLPGSCHWRGFSIGVSRRRTGWGELVGRGLGAPGRGPGGCEGGGAERTSPPMPQGCVWGGAQGSGTPVVSPDVREQGRKTTGGGVRV